MTISRNGPGRLVLRASARRAVLGALALLLGAVALSPAAVAPAAGQENAAPGDERMTTEAPPVLGLRRPALRIDVPLLPRRPDTLDPILYTCEGWEDCQSIATEFCRGFNYPNGRILFRELPPTPRPFPVYSVICFD